MSSSSSSSTRGWKPDVFLNFYGDDTRNGFTSHLYAAFKENGINAFMDDEKLERGKLIAPELCKAIEESKYAVVVLSRNYALSRWCLFELATIVECKKKKMLTILPIFYHVEPSHVRQQTGSFAEAFVRYEQSPNIRSEDLQTWKAALREVGNTAGWPLHNRSESAIIKEIVATIQGRSKLSSGVCKDQVGLIDQEFRGENFSKLKDIDQSDHDVLGIIYDGSREVVLKLDIHDEKAKRTAIKTVSTLAGIDSIRMDMKVKKLTVTGTMDPIELVSKLRKYCFADIISIVRPKQVVEKKGEPRSWKEEPKKEEKKGQQVKKEEIKKKEEEEEEEKISELVKAYNAYNPYRTSHNYYVQSMEEKPKEQEAKKKENIERGDHFEEIANNYRAYYNPNLTQYYYVQTAEESNPNSCVIC